MTVELDSPAPAQEIKRLERCIADLVNLVALPASWVGAEPGDIGRSLLDAIEDMLSLDLAFLRLTDHATGRPIELARVAPGRRLPGRADAVGAMVDLWLDEDPGRWPQVLRRRVGLGELSLVPLPVGLHGDLGILVAGSEREDFPSETERLLLTVAKNQALIALREARLVDEHRRLAGALDRRVAQRTAELTAAGNGLRRSEARKAAILDSALDGIVTFDDDGRITEFNRAAERVFGHRREDVLGAPIGEVLLPALGGGHRGGMARYLSTGRAPTLGRRVEMTARRADGSELPVEVAITRIPDDGPPSFTGYLRDLTERKQRDAGFRTIVDTTPECVKLVAQDGTLLLVNAAGAAMGGAPSPEAVTGANFYDFLAPEDRERYREFHDRVCNGEKSHLEYTIVTLQGERRRMESNAAPMRYHDGTVVLLAVARDITARKVSEEQLQRSEAFLAEAQRLSLTGSFAWRPDTDQITWSDQVYRIFELDPADSVTFERIRTRIHPDDFPLLAGVLDRARADGAGFEFEHRLLMPDRSVKYLHVVAHAARNARGGLEFIGAVQDVTERRRSHEALDRAREELTRVARVTSLGALTASIAHEVNQPLSGVVTNASTGLRMLAAEPPNIAGARETLRRTIRDGHRASEVVTRLRGLFARKDLAAEPVDLNDATREVIALMAGALRRGRVTVREELAEDLPPVPGDRVQFQQVILNLLLNAADAMSGVAGRPRQMVVRTARAAGDEVCLSVQDTGVGFAPEDGERLFEAFYTTKDQGMGIGLSVSRSIIERHHGRLWAVANEGPGATFAFTVPVGADTKV